MLLVTLFFLFFSVRAQSSLYDCALNLDHSITRLQTFDFPDWRAQQAKLSQFAESLDESARNFGAATATGGALALFGGLAAAAGVFLAPVTGGASLIITAGMGVATAGTALSIGTHLWRFGVSASELKVVKETQDREEYLTGRLLQFSTEVNEAREEFEKQWENATCGQKARLWTQCQMKLDEKGAEIQNVAVCVFAWKLETGQLEVDRQPTGEEEDIPIDESALLDTTPCTVRSTASFLKTATLATLAKETASAANAAASTTKAAATAAATATSTATKVVSSTTTALSTAAPQVVATVKASQSAAIQAAKLTKKLMSLNAVLNVALGAWDVVDGVMEYNEGSCEAKYLRSVLSTLAVEHERLMESVKYFLGNGGYNLNPIRKFFLRACQDETKRV